MFRKIALTVALIAMFGSFLTSASDIIDLGPQVTTIAMEQNDRGENVIQVTVSEVRLDAIDIDGQRWAAPRVPEASNLMEQGLPSLPFLESQYILGRTDGIELRLTGVVTSEIDLGTMDFIGIAPSKGHFDRSIDPDSVAWTFDPEVYGGNKPYPSRDVWIDSPVIAGPWRAQTFRIPVATWDATTNILTVVEQATFEIVSIAEASNPRLGPDRAPTALFGSMAGAVNAASTRNTRSADAGRLLILAYDDFVDEVQPLADWETLVGYPTLLTPLSSVAPTPTTAEIMTYIQGLYDSPEGLAWIILVGDYAQIPNFEGVNERADCDPCYTKLEGADNRPDASISRISAQNEADVTIQVDKILHYEQQPDTGGAATWYDHAFGIAGDDSGGTPSFRDWERMDFLRDILIDPEYTFTEFDQLYHDNLTKAEVTASIEDGKSLGFYIGHGSDTSWVTSGYSVNDVHGLVNGEMLPVIWSVACVNGNFRPNNECFAEAWLRQEGGGAVIFEGATTNESWVPPCDAQRGFVDAIRLETDFTVGAQHIAGKIACMNIWGDNDSSEGTMFMEQSHLFGSSVLWPRTVEPMAVDMPQDFSIAGGMASLTVEVDGAPLAKAGAAIVNFYTTDGNTITSVGSGLIDATGTVQAAVSAEPSHCHIHGHNLLPQSFELAAQQDGRVNLDGAVYSCSSTAGIRVADANVPGSTAGVIDTLNVDVSAGGAPISVVLTETGADTDFYNGTVELGSDLPVADGDTLTVTYQDADTGSGPQAKTATATIDCVPPGIGAIQTSADHESLTISFFTDEPGTTLIRWGTTTPPTNFVTDDALVDGTHTVMIEGLDPCARIFFEVGSTDAVGNTTLDTNGGAFYAADTLGWSVYFEETMDTEPFWVIDNGGSGNGWEFGIPQGGGGAYGQPDPTSGSTGDNVYGVNLSGDYDNNLTDSQLKVTTPAIDLSAATAVQLSYRRWLGVEQPIYDHARVQVSIDGGLSWTTVWENDATIEESAWSEQTIDLTSIAVGQSDVRIRWTQGSTDSAWQYSGWNIDDVRLEGSAPCAGVGSLFVDGFEGGSCDQWNVEVGGL